MHLLNRCNQLINYIPHPIMQYTTTRINGLYSFATIAGVFFRTRYSPKKIAQMYCFDAIDEWGNLRVVLSDDVDFRSFEFMPNIHHSSVA
jgi:hypothetical protein